MNNFKNRFSFPSEEVRPTEAMSRDGGMRGSAHVTADAEVHSTKSFLADDFVSRIILAPNDGKRHDRLFHEFRNRLIAEFEPRTFSKKAAIDQLAHDYARLTCARAAIEVPQPMPAISPGNAEKRKSLSENRANLESIRAASEFLSGFKKCCEPEQAQRTADLIHRWIKRLEADVTPNEDFLSESEMDDAEKQELRKLEAQWAALQPFVKKLADRDHLNYVFIGCSSIRSGERRQLQKLLGDMAENQELVTWCLNLNKPPPLPDMLPDLPPKELIQLQRYISDLQKSIDRQLQSLRKK